VTFRKLLIANRGEIAVRITRACRELGTKTVAVFSEADANAMHRRLADEAHPIGSAPAPESYLNVERLVSVIEGSGTEAVHPGYGFLSESAAFARAVEGAGAVWVGPTPGAMDLVGDKVRAKELASRASVPTLLVRAWVPEGGATLLADKPKLLVPLDGSHFAEEALPVATELADTLGGELVLLRAVARPDVPLGPDALMSPLLKWELDKERGEAEDYLQQLAGRFAGEGRTVQTAVRVGRPDMGMAATVIEATGHEYAAALVVMASHRHSGVERLLLGSVADATVRHGTLPVLLVHPQPRPSTDGG
jgi:nucleotide-binding universal stress UspA family protein